MVNKEFLKQIPETTGVYVMYSETGEVLYIGKSVNLKNRITSYFTSKNHSRRIQNLVNKVAKIDYIVVNTESEALILEANLIKRHKPRYNVLMKDSKFFPFVKLSKDEFPYINATRKYEPSHEFEYFGPFTDSTLPHKLVDVIQRVFKIRTCRKMPKKACLNYYIDRCSAPCEKKISPIEYINNVEKTKKVLKGEIDEVIAILEKEMKESAKDLNFEKASFLRDSINALKEIETQKQFVFSADEFTTADYISFSETEDLINFYIAHIIGGKFLGKESITLEKKEEENPLEKFLSSIYLLSSEDLKISRIFAEVEMLHGIRSFFDKIKDSISYPIDILAPQEEKDSKILEICRKNSEITLNEHLARIDMENKELEELCNILGIESISVIDGFDVANYGDEISVGSSVRFIDGVASKKYYRVFKIKTVEGQNDFGMIEEIVYRRYSREKEDGQLPELILVDGGKGQLNSATRSLKKLELNIPVIALAKQEEKIILPNGEELKLPRSSYALRLLQRIRDEAHRFGNTFIRNIKSKRMSR
ncbi:MAG: excinuclease ABC subunit UvrC [Brevinematia bacterium]